MALPAVRARCPEINIATLESKFRFSSSMRSNSEALDMQTRYIISQLAVAIENLGDYALDVFPYGLAREYDAHIYCYVGLLPVFLPSS